MSGLSLLWLLIGVPTMIVAVRSNAVERIEPFCHMRDGLACFTILMLWPYLWWQVWRRG